MDPVAHTSSIFLVVNDKVDCKISLSNTVKKQRNFFLNVDHESIHRVCIIYYVKILKLFYSMIFMQVMT